jgi:hypothetical protein
VRFRGSRSPGRPGDLYTLRFLLYAAPDPEPHAYRIPRSTCIHSPTRSVPDLTRVVTGRLPKEGARDNGIDGLVEKGIGPSQPWASRTVTTTADPAVVG